jgi:gas vesicle protein
MKEETVMNRDHVIGFGVGLLTGAVVGGVIALLYAPKTGTETRQLIRDKAGSVVNAVRGKTSEVVDSVKEKSSGVVQALKS